MSLRQASFGFQQILTGRICKPNEDSVAGVAEDNCRALGICSSQSSLAARNARTETAIREMIQELRRLSDLFGCSCPQGTQLREDITALELAFEQKRVCECTCLGKILAHAEQIFGVYVGPEVSKILLASRLNEVVRASSESLARLGRFEQPLGLSSAGLDIWARTEQLFASMQVDPRDMADTSIKERLDFIEKQTAVRVEQKEVVAAFQAVRPRPEDDDDDADGPLTLQVRQLCAQVGIQFKQDSERAMRTLRKVLGTKDPAFLAETKATLASRVSKMRTKTNELAEHIRICEEQVHCQNQEDQSLNDRCWNIVHEIGIQNAEIELIKVIEACHVALGVPFHVENY